MPVYAWTDPVVHEQVLDDEVGDQGLEGRGELLWGQHGQVTQRGEGRGQLLQVARVQALVEGLDTHTQRHTHTHTHSLWCLCVFQVEVSVQTLIDLERCFNPGGGAILEEKSLIGWLDSLLS